MNILGMKFAMLLTSQVITAEDCDCDEFGGPSLAVLIDAVVRQQADANGYSRSLLNRIQRLEKELIAAKAERDTLSQNTLILLDRSQSSPYCDLSHDHALMMDQQRESMELQHKILARNTTFVMTDITYDMYYGSIMGVLVGMIFTMIVGFALYCVKEQDSETRRRRDTHRLAIELAAALRTQDLTPQAAEEDQPPSYNMAVTVTTSV